MCLAKHCGKTGVDCLGNCPCKKGGGGGGGADSGELVGRRVETAKSCRSSLKRTQNNNFAEMASCCSKMWENRVWGGR